MNKKYHPPKLLNRLSISIIIICFMIMIMIAMLQHFALTLPNIDTEINQKTDAIIVTTGGQARIEKGLRLLSDGIADKLLITGVGRGVNKTALLQEMRFNEQETKIWLCCVDLDNTAQDTKGNAVASHKWLDLHQLESIILVTANYHMPRALYLFKRQMPNINIAIAPVCPPDLCTEAWYKNWTVIRLLGREYLKYLYALLWHK